MNRAEWEERQREAEFRRVSLAVIDGVVICPDCEAPLTQPAGEGEHVYMCDPCGMRYGLWKMPEAPPLCACGHPEGSHGATVFPREDDTECRRIFCACERWQP